MHIVKLIRHRFPENSNLILNTLVLLSCTSIAIGIGLLLLTR